MTHKNALFHQSVLIEPDISRLAVHFGDRLSRCIRIIRSGGILAGKIRRGILEIRQIDINQTVKHFQRFNLFISAAVIYNRNFKLRSDFFKNARYNIGIMRRGHKIDIMSALFLEFKHNLTQSFR